MSGREESVQRGEIWWVDLGDPSGSEPGYRRPVLVVQSDLFNRTALNTVTVLALTSNLRMAGLPGNVLLSRRRTGLAKDSVANVTQLATIDKEDLIERSGRLTPAEMEKIADGLRLVLTL